MFRLYKITSSSLFYPIVFVLYFIFLFFLYYQTGIITNHEAKKYISAANEIINGNIAFSFKNYFLFSSYNFFLVICFFISGLKFAILIQVFLSIVSAFCINKIVLKLTSSTILSKIAFLVFLFSYLIQFWVLTFFSESFFISISIVFLFFVTCKNYSLKNIFFIVLIGAILIFSRPQGILVIIPSIIFLIQKKFNYKKIIGIILFLALSIVFFSTVLIQVCSCEDVIKPICESSIICGFPEKPNEVFNLIDCTILNAHTCLIEKNSFWYDFKLCCRKAFSFFVLTREYYSPTHNFIMMLHYPLYILALFSFKNNNETILFHSIILMNVILISLTFNEWHGRYLSVVYPMIIVLSMFGTKQLLKLIGIKQIQ